VDAKVIGTIMKNLSIERMFQAHFHEYIVITDG